MKALTIFSLLTLTFIAVLCSMEFGISTVILYTIGLFPVWGIVVAIVGNIVVDIAESITAYRKAHESYEIIIQRRNRKLNTIALTYTK